MKLSLRIDAEGQYGLWSYCMKIPELYLKEFEQLKTCDDFMVAMATGDVMHDQVQIVMKRRKDAAEILARELTKVIISAMERNDTHNGYLTMTNRYV